MMKPTRRLAKVQRTEAQFQAAVRQLAVTLGWKVFSQRYALSADPGFPDIFLVRRGKAVAMELKGPRGRVTDAQREWHLQLNAASIPTYLLHDTDEHWKIIEEVLR